MDADLNSTRERVLVLSKRQYMGHDLLDDRFGRFRELPLELNKLGHPVAGVCLSYSHRPRVRLIDREGEAAVQWTSVNLGSLSVIGALKHWFAIQRVAERFKPDVILTMSDAFHVIRGVNLARSIGVKVVADLYDNFESYRGTAFPGVMGRFIRAIRSADIVTCVSPPLAQHVQAAYGRLGSTVVLENGVDRELFFPGDRVEARRSLNLPIDMPLVGVFGALKHHRDIDVVFQAVDLLSSSERPHGLLTAGPRDGDLQWPEKAILFDFGVVHQSVIPDLLRASDVAVVPNRLSSFGWSSYPQKACEALACGIPIVAAATPVMTSLLGEADRGLYRPGDAFDLSRALQSRLDEPSVTSNGVRDWGELAMELSALISSQ